MKIIESAKVKEKAYIEKIENGLTVIIIPKKNILKKYAIIGTHFGSIDNRFIMPKTGEEVFIPDGVAHYLEHKMFEQENGVNSLDKLMALGLEANAYTTNDHTAYLFECTDNFYEGLDELMDYVQNPYFTDENVEKEKGIISQEINMYDDEPSWKVYMNALDCLYRENPIKIDVAGTVESISEIDKEVLYKCYNTFYNPNNMVLVVCGDFEPEELLKEIKKRVIKKDNQGEIKRIYPPQEDGINKEYAEKTMDISNEIYIIGFKDKILEDKAEIVKRHIAIEILLNMLMGKSSSLYKELYEEGLTFVLPDLDYEFSSQYAHVLISGQSKDSKKVRDKLKEKILKYSKEGLSEEDFKRISKKVYGDYVVEYNSVEETARMFLADYMKGINCFDYIEKFGLVTFEYLTEVFEDCFVNNQMILSVVKGKK
ncbi:MAG: pitrilysin family protein [Clostridia bacterium]|nr:pitrilysin family protein [Clostridia bacterium]